MNTPPYAASTRPNSFSGWKAATGDPAPRLRVVDRRRDRRGDDASLQLFHQVEGRSQH
jgi:hypothetical protein